MRLILCAMLLLCCSVAKAEYIQITNARAEYFPATDEVRFLIDFAQPPTPAIGFSIAAYDQDKPNLISALIDARSISGQTIGVNDMRTLRMSPVWRPQEEIARVPFTMAGKRFETYVPFNLLHVDSHEFLWEAVSTTGGFSHATINTPEPSSFAIAIAGIATFSYRVSRLSKRKDSES